MQKSMLNRFLPPRTHTMLKQNIYLTLSKNQKDHVTYCYTSVLYSCVHYYKVTSCFKAGSSGVVRGDRTSGYPCGAGYFSQFTVFS